MLLERHKTSTDTTHTRLHKHTGCMRHAKPFPPAYALFTVQDALVEKEVQLVKQAEVRARGNSTIVDSLLMKVNEQRQELSRLHDTLQKKQAQLLQQQQELKATQMQLWEQDSAEMDVRAQLRQAEQRAEKAEATAASARWGTQLLCCAVRVLMLPVARP